MQAYKVKRFRKKLGTNLLFFSHPYDLAEQSTSPPVKT